MIISRDTKGKEKMFVAYGAMTLKVKVISFQKKPKFDSVTSLSNKNIINVFEYMRKHEEFNKYLV